MRLRPPDLARHLQGPLRPIYLLTGDEPLQMGELADQLRAAARAAGHDDRELIEADARFDWNRLAAEAGAMSLFSSKRLIDLRLPGGKPGAEGGKALAEYAAQVPEDLVLLLTLPKLERGQLNSKWFKALESAGVVIQVWPVEGAQLPRWIEQRMRDKGLQPSREAVLLLAERIEGNLLAAAQEIDKLLLLFGPGKVDAEQLTGAVGDSARYDVFGLVDSALEGRVDRTLKMINGLHGEGTAAPVVLWALSRELRLLCSLAEEVARGRSASQVVTARREVWDKRKPLVTKGLQRLSLKQARQLLQLCGDADRAIKGRDSREPWSLLTQIACGIAGAPPMPKLPRSA